MNTIGQFGIFYRAIQVCLNSIVRGADASDSPHYLQIKPSKSNGTNVPDVEQVLNYSIKLLTSIFVP